MYILFAYIKKQEENKVKKILALILALAVILSLGACADKGDSRMCR